MFQQFYQPHPALKEFVNNIMIHEVNFDVANAKSTFPFPPLPEQGLYFYIRDRMGVEYKPTGKKETLSHCIVVGPQLNGMNITLGHHHLLLKVGFQPGGLYRFLGIPMHELLQKEAFDATELLGNEIREINEQLQESISFLQMKNIVESYLLKHIYKLKQILPIDFVLPLLIKEGGLVKIERLASHACLSLRQFERVFEQRIGLQPKYFSRLVRFAHAWVIKEQHPNISWTNIAYECGYFDQMHLIRDFKEFAGVNPSYIESELLKSHVSFNNQLFW